MARIPAIAHEPVMVAEVLEVLGAAPGGVLLDGTVGTGGHALAWLARTAPGGRVIGLDRDPGALARARERLAGAAERVLLVHGDWREAPALLAEAGEATPTAILLDLGIGTHQVDDPDRGFSFRHDAPLDMRFDPTSPGPSAAEILRRAPEPELARIFREYGEERAARRLARRVVEERRRRPLETTGEFARLVHETLGPRRAGRIDPATRAFQALRIAVNRELEGMGEALEALVEMLPRGGRIAVLAYHSLEDRIVKRTFRALAEPCRCRRGDPCTCGARQWLELRERRARRPSDEEVARNPRARSARLRWGVRR